MTDRYRVTFWSYKNVLELDSCDKDNLMSIQKHTGLYILNGWNLQYMCNSSILKMNLKIYHNPQKQTAEMEIVPWIVPYIQFLSIFDDSLVVFVRY